MKKFPVSVSWIVEKVIFIDANTEAGALDQALNVELTDGDVVSGSRITTVLIPSK